MGAESMEQWMDGWDRTVKSTVNAYNCIYLYHDTAHPVSRCALGV